MNSIDECVYVQDDNLKNMELRGVPVLKLATPRGVGLDLGYADPVFETPVPVFEETVGGEVIGAAHLYVKDTLVLADIFIAYSSPMRLTIEAGQRVYPGVSATVTKMDDDKIKEIYLECVILKTVSSNAKFDLDLSKYVVN